MDAQMTWSEILHKRKFALEWNFSFFHIHGKNEEKLEDKNVAMEFFLSLLENSFGANIF